MNNPLLYLSIGVPALAVIPTRLSRQSDINRLNDKLDRPVEIPRAEMTSTRNDHHKDLALLGHMVPLHKHMAMLGPRG